MNLTTARARIHAMFTAPDDAATEELDHRIDALIAAARDDEQPAHNPTVKAGDRVEITAAQSYDITWDENGDLIVGEYGVLLNIDAPALADNTSTGTYDSAPYKVRLDNGDEVSAADVMPEADGLRRTIAGLDKSLDDRLQRIRDLEARLAELEAEPRPDEPSDA